MNSNGVRTVPEPSNQVNESWRIDFIRGEFQRNNFFLKLEIVDNVRRESLMFNIDKPITDHKVIKILDQVVLSRGIPKYIIYDLSRELNTEVLGNWTDRNNVQRRYRQFSGLL